MQNGNHLFLSRLALRLCFVALFFSVTPSLPATTVSTSNAGATCSLTVTWNSANHWFDYSYTQTGNGGLEQNIYYLKFAPGDYSGTNPARPTNSSASAWGGHTGGTGSGSGHFTASGQAWITFAVDAVPGGVYVAGTLQHADLQDPDPYVPTSSTPTAQRKPVAPFRIVNPYSGRVQVGFKDAVTGEIYQTAVLNPGDEFITSFQKNNTNDVIPIFQLLDNVSWIETDANGVQHLDTAPAGTQWSGTTISDSTAFGTTDFGPSATPTNITNVVPLIYVTDNDPNVTTTQTGNGSTTTVVNGSTNVVKYTVATGGSGVTDATVREGNNAIIQMLQQIKAGQTTTTVTGTLSDTGTHTRLDTIIAQNTTAPTTAGTSATTFLTANTYTGAQTAANSGGTSGQSNASSALATMSAAPGSIVAASAPAAAPTGSMVIHANATTDVTIFDNPFDAGGPFSGVLANLASFVKRLIGWAIVMAFYGWVLRRIKQSVDEFFRVAPFSKSLEDSVNSIKIWGFGGGVGYTARAAGLVILLPFILTLPLVLITAVTAGLPWSTIATTVLAGPGDPSGTMLTNALAIANTVLPWQTMLFAPIWYVALEYILFPTTFFWQMFKQFLPS